jgi:hypothetical protein
VCGHHHDLKTHNGYRFGPLGPNGKRQLIAPDAQPGDSPDTGCIRPVEHGARR